MYLSLYNNSLNGIIPIEIGNLTILHSCLGYNNLTGPFLPQSSTFLHCKKLYWETTISLVISHPNIDYLPRLLHLNLVGIQLSGKIPSSLFKCKSLEHLELYDNHLEAETVPLEITNLTSLVYFSIPKTNISGEIPSFIGNMTSLEYIDLSYNNLRGEISSNIGNLPFLRDFFVLENKLSGQIPNLQPSLQGYGVADNYLVGEIPYSICNLSSPDSLYLSENRLDGKIPECLGNLTSSLSLVELQNNNFHGEIPKSFAQGCTLQSFRINNNQIEGSLPQSLSNCKELKVLDVGNNYLNDSFPYWLVNLDKLQVLILRSNRFYGRVDNSDVAVSFGRCVSSIFL
ncbi:receptor-like protein 43 [Hibiscus syriacus]|uniref:receptor-like protein 43 n=1 Tax=Hibiscus syriacus TaxID=106335 RepID=UPI0019229AEC|nr:receptor-like protein 43 [Hibiscus syriacus]